MIELSVLVPAYQAAATLPFALASLVAQEVGSWEAVIVDDGSRDGTSELLARLAAREPRFRVIGLPNNRGRGFARWTALAAARGRYVAFLDADDWCYPWRFARQLEFLEQEPDCGLVSTGMAVVGRAGGLAGIRAGNEAVVGRRFRSGGFQPPEGIWFAPSLLRTELARRIGFAAELRYAEDFDFLGRLVAIADTAILGETLYAYSELASVGVEKIVATFREVDTVLIRAVDRTSWWRARRRAAVRAKILAYRGLFAAGLGDSVLHSRSRPATAAEREDFERAHEAVRSAWYRLAPEADRKERT